MDRRSVLIGIGTALAAPAIVKAENLMKLWVPPKPKLIVDLATEPDATGWFWTRDGKRVGQWSQVGGRMTYKYTNPEQKQPSNGIYWQSGHGGQFSDMVRFCELAEIRPYPFTPA